MPFNILLKKGTTYVFPARGLLWNRSHHPSVSPCCYFTSFDIITARARSPLYQGRRFCGNINVFVSQVTKSKIITTYCLVFISVYNFIFFIILFLRYISYIIQKPVVWMVHVTQCLYLVVLGRGQCVKLCMVCRRIILPDPLPVGSHQMFIVLEYFTKLWLWATSISYVGCVC